MLDVNTEINCMWQHGCSAEQKVAVVPAVGLGPQGEMLIAVKHLWRQKRADKSKAVVINSLDTRVCVSSKRPRLLGFDFSR